MTASQQSSDVTYRYCEVNIVKFRLCVCTITIWIWFCVSEIHFIIFWLLDNVQAYKAYVRPASISHHSHHRLRSVILFRNNEAKRLLWCHLVLFSPSNVKTINFTVLTLNTIKSHCCGLGIGGYKPMLKRPT